MRISDVSTLNITRGLKNYNAKYYKFKNVFCSWPHWAYSEWYSPNRTICVIVHKTSDFTFRTSDSHITVTNITGEITLFNLFLFLFIAVVNSRVFNGERKTNNYSINWERRFNLTPLRKHHVESYTLAEINKWFFFSRWDINYVVKTRFEICSTIIFIHQTLWDGII